MISLGSFLQIYNNGEKNKKDRNFKNLNENLQILKKSNGKKNLKIIKIQCKIHLY